MPEPRYLIAAALLALLTAVPLTGWPPGQVSAHAQTAREPRGATRQIQAGNALDLLTVAASNENERLDREERRERNQNDQDDNDDGDDWQPPPPPSAPADQPPPEQTASCLAGGDSVTIALPGGGASVKVFQDNLFVELARVDPSSVPSPGNLVGQLVFRLSVAPCGGQALGTFPSEANLGVTYTSDSASGRDESKFALMIFDGQRWTPAPKQAGDSRNRHVSATIAAPGMYALVQQ